MCDGVVQAPALLNVPAALHAAAPHRFTHPPCSCAFLPCLPQLQVCPFLPPHGCLIHTPAPCLPQLQLQEATYTPDTVAVLRRVAEEVEGAVGAAAARLQQARFTFCCFDALVPGLMCLAGLCGSAACCWPAWVCMKWQLVRRVQTMSTSAYQGSDTLAYQAGGPTAHTGACPTLQHAPLPLLPSTCRPLCSCSSTAPSALPSSPRLQSTRQCCSRCAELSAASVLAMAGMQGGCAGSGLQHRHAWVLSACSPCMPTHSACLHCFLSTLCAAGRNGVRAAGD